MSNVNRANAGPEWGVWGNEMAVDRMQRAVRSGPRHAYIISGLASTGKSTLAASFAAALMCPERDRSGSSCGSCSTCRRITRGIHPDVARFDLAYQVARDDSKSKNTSLNIETVREIGRCVSLKPVEASWRLVVVDDVETMQEPAQEAFLKTLEEPPSYVVLLLLTSDAELLLPTILSRCSLVTMSPVPDPVVEEALVAHGARPDDAQALAVASRGRVGVALAALDDEDRKTLLLESVARATSWVAGDPFARVAQSFRLADRFSESRETVFEQLLAVEVAWRELLLDFAANVESSSHPVLASCRLARLEDGHRALVAIDRCMRDLDANVRPRAALETMVLQWPNVNSGAST